MTVNVVFVEGPGKVYGDYDTKLINGHNLIVCACGEKAVWNSGSSSKTSKFYCDDHVPRGVCNCNDYFGDLNLRSPVTERRLEDDGRELPCVDYWHDVDGYEGISGPEPE